MNRLRQLVSDTTSVVSGRWPAWTTRLKTGVVGGALLFFLLAANFTGPFLGTNLLSQATDAAASVRSLIAVDTTSRTATDLSSTPALRNFSSHPSTKLAPYMNPGGRSSEVANPPVLSNFHDLLDQFTQRQAEDDNFTVRVTDRRTDKVLEVYELTDLRRAYQRDGSVDWRAVDQRRREVTRTLVDKYERQGVPLEDIIVRWGRTNQVGEAQERNRPYHRYEIRLAQALGLSLLPTQIGTVETFNQDDLVSPAGAKSRYQMMPWILRRSGVNEYKLPTGGGSSVAVEEANHPLLTMEPAFLLLRGYVNAVGHEIPGLSAYHTGPGNIYMLYRKYFTESTRYNPSSTVADAYIWAVTEGFGTVREETSFGPFSRGYVPSLYGALNARTRRPVDLSETVRVARVQLKRGTRVSLGEILTVLDTTGRAFDWGPAAKASSTYNRFRALNKHFDLPKSQTGDVPEAGNVQLPSTIDGKGVRFFLPLGAPQALRQADLDILDPNLTFRFDESTFGPPTDEQRTKWDKQYDALVNDIGRFGFTPDNRDRLMALHEKFEELAEANPSRYRQRQLTVIRTHRRIWRSNPWDKLSDLTMKMTGRDSIPTQPPAEISSLRDPSTPLP